MPVRDKRPYRLGLDLGSNSLGWFVVWLDESGEVTGLGPGGVRIFPDGRDPKSKTSNAVERRMARGARRRRDRYLRRRSNLISLLAAHGLMPQEPASRKALEQLDPYELRARALAETLPPHHIGRALFHLNQRRGFLSNRKVEKKDSDIGAIKQGASHLRELMEASGARTLGEFLYGRHRNRQYVRARNRGVGAKAEYEFYPTRELLLAEFDAIWAKQAPHNHSMTAAARDSIRSAIFHQRPLKQPPVGKCSLSPAKNAEDVDGFRSPWAHPLAQRFRIWQEVRNLSVVETGKRPRLLSSDEGAKVAHALIQTNKVSFDRIRTLLDLPSESRFNLESERRTELTGDQTAAKLSHKSLFGRLWRSFPVEHQAEIVVKLLDEADEGKLTAWLTEHAGLDEATSRRVASAYLPDGHCRLGMRTIKAILPFMEKGLNYADAAKAAGFDHALQPTGLLSPNGRLPYYGQWLADDVLGSGDPRDPVEKRWGRFPNPTVHIGLGQLRRVVNTLIQHYGPPAEISLEMTRDFKLSPKKLSELEQEQAQNQRQNDRRRVDIEGLGYVANTRNLLKMRLWEELNLRDALDRRCPFSGEVIGVSKLFSDEVEIEHLIPFADCWDDSAANKVVCLRSANRLKGKQTPFEAFGQSPEWEEIRQRAANLPKNKRWRFSPDARQRFDEQGGFLARQLNETGWLARAAKQYLAAVTDPNKVQVLPGRLTALIRAKWGLNTLLPDHNFSDAKNRKDHRHHAIDAMVAAMTDRSLLHRLSSAFDEERDKIVVPLPWPLLRDDLDARLKSMTVSYKPDHGLQAKLHEDTAYGAVRDAASVEGNLVCRRPFSNLNEQEIARIRDVRLRKLVQQHVEIEKAAGRTVKDALHSFGARRDVVGLPHGIRHVRLLKAEKAEYLVELKDRSGKPYKYYSAGENAFLEIYETADGRWEGEAVSVFGANRGEDLMRWQAELPGARLVMRIFKGDLLRIDHDGTEKIVRVVRLEPSAKRVRLATSNEAGTLQKRHDDPLDPFRWIFGYYANLKEWNAERVRVDELGRVWRVQQTLGDP